MFATHDLSQNHGAMDNFMFLWRFKGILQPWGYFKVQNPSCRVAHVFLAPTVRPYSSISRNLGIAFPSCQERRRNNTDVFFDRDSKDGHQTLGKGCHPEPSFSPAIVILVRLSRRHNRVVAICSPIIGNNNSKRVGFAK